MIKNRFFRLLCFGLLMIAYPFLSEAEFYQYSDQDGNLIFTDDLSRVPVNQRDKVKTFNSIESEDIQLIEADNVRGQGESLQKDAVAEREMLEREYLRLQQDRKSLMEQKKTLKTLVEQQEYNEKVILLNQQIEDFSQRIESFNKTISEVSEEVGDE